jgi:hypothetical protein
MRNYDHEEKEKENVLSNLISRCTRPTPCIHPTALHSSHHIRLNTLSPAKINKKGYKQIRIQSYKER